MTDYHIYKITNNFDSNVYIGQTMASLEERFGEHCCKSSGCLKIRNAIQKHGKENFKIELITIASSQNEANLFEDFYIDEYDSINNGYNIIKASIPPMSGRKHSIESRQKMSEAQMGDKSHNFGKIPSDETKQKLSESHLGEKNYWFGKDFSFEHKQQISSAIAGENHPMFGKEHTDESRQKMSESHTGKIVSEETKTKMSAAQKAVGNKPPSQKGKPSHLKGKTWKIVNGKRVYPTEISGT